MHKNCYYHPQQSLHNFCFNKSCALPLCPKCIHLHLHQNPTVQHHIMPLQDLSSMIKQQIATSQQALQAALQSLKSTNNPQAYVDRYSQLLQKYKQQAIFKINRHFDNLQKTLMVQINNKYNLHLAPYQHPLTEKLLQIKKWSKIIQQGRQVQVIINIVHNDTINDIQSLLNSFQKNKTLMINNLPKLQYNHNDQLQVLPFHNPINVNVQKNQFQYELQSLDPYCKTIDRIIDLENKLFALRTKN